MQVLEYQHRAVEEAYEIAAAISSQFPSDHTADIDNFQRRRQANLPALPDFGVASNMDIYQLRQELCRYFGIESADEYAVHCAQVLTTAVPASKKETRLPRSFLVGCSVVLGAGLLGACAIMFR